jgi:hypothetical protein
VNDTTTSTGQEPKLDNNKISLLGVYATQFGSYTTLLWQVPALSLTAQSFLLTIAVGSGSSNYARLISSGLSVIIALSSYALMHDQRGHAINYGKISEYLSAQMCLGTLKLNENDAVPRTTDAALLWTDSGGGSNYPKIAQIFKPFSKFITSSPMYAVWRICILLFLLADILVIYSTLMGYKWFVVPSA